MSNSNPAISSGRRRARGSQPARRRRRASAWRAEPGGETYDRTRRRLLEAAVGCLAAHGHDALRMHVVAERAGVSRATLYRYFRHKDDLIVAVAVYNAERVAAAAVRRIDSTASPQDQILQGMVYAVDAFRTDPQLAAAGDHSDARVAGILTRSSSVLDAAVQALESRLEDARRQAALRRDLTIADAAQWLIFVGMGLVRSGWPIVTRSGAKLRHADKVRFLRRFLVPSLFAP